MTACSAARALRTTAAAPSKARAARREMKLACPCSMARPPGSRMLAYHAFAPAPNRVTFAISHPSNDGVDRHTPGSGPMPGTRRREACMRLAHLTYVAALAAAPLLTPIAAQAFDDAKYPDWKGEWRRVAVPAGKYPGVQFDPHKPAGPFQEAPLTPEYQRIFEANLADQAEGGQAGDPTFKCLSPGMPRVMGPYGAMEIVVMPETTYVMIDHIRDSRRIHTDGRDFPAAQMA